jgi:hypothetical protein
VAEARPVRAGAEVPTESSNPGIEVAQCFSVDDPLVGYQCYLVNRSAAVVKRVRFLAGCRFYGGRGDSPQEVRDLPPGCFRSLGGTYFIEPGPQAHRILELEWADGTIQRNLELPVVNYRVADVAAILGRRV